MPEASPHLQPHRADRITFTPLIDGYFLSGLKQPKTDIQLLKENSSEILKRDTPIYNINLARIPPCSHQPRRTLAN